MRPLKRAAHARLPLRHPARYLTTTTTLAAATASTDPSNSASSAFSSASASPSTAPLTSLLIANRGEIALRIHRTATRLGIPTTTLYTAVDAHAQHARASPRSLALGSYLDGDRIVALAQQHGIRALHPGYGFLSENAAFAARCADAGITFVGPPPQAMQDMGDKARSKALMTAAGVPCVPGYHGEDQAPEQLAAHAEAAVGYPVLLKSVRGGGGKGMRIVRTPGEFAAQLRSARAEARASFGPDGEVMLVERYVVRPRHVEVQVFADTHGNVVALGERDCSVQRRHQKILEESPAPALDDALRRQLWATACTAARAVGYVGAGTVEFLLDCDTGEFFFMEMNTRLQVEHPVSELVTGTDLVEWQLRVAAGEPLPLISQDAVAARIRARGHAIEARIYAENPEMGFVPDAGRLVHLATPQTTGRNDEDSDLRIDAGFAQGDTVSEAYDGMLAKLIVRGADRAEALQKLALALEAYEVAGVHTNIEFLKRLCREPAFRAGDVETGFIEKNRDTLFAPTAVADEVYVQAALALLVAEESKGHMRSTTKRDEALHGQPLGFGEANGGGTAERSVAFEVRDAYSDRTGDVVEVALTQTGRRRYNARVSWQTKPAAAAAATTTQATKTTTTTTEDVPNVVREYDGIVLDTAASEQPTADATTTRLTSFFPLARIASTVVQQQPAAASDGPVRVTVFQGGHKTELARVPPAWHAKVLGVDAAAAAASVVAPMPCKILRNEVTVGETVDKGAPLVVIESMKMETVIRSPQQGVIKKMAHKEGDICKAGTVLVLFEEAAAEPGKDEEGKEAS
ncbi:3-methylcrotonyl-carboxylase subunit alpha [Niveomyces insectorum RCEF 264]|uniref:3-methylcrotonyl-carboxylase subunit alpha n=1 Tax=Niveomyces insectorum RCEF 264 TaxID=1081102 RepID=A0A167ULH8_9HYPO|nr:3-methylcrotonyl-carboxylase subunit alpha [Niveomyces insectorum RCEF 264]